MRPRSAETAVWFGRSRLSSGSSRSSSSGRAASACAIRSRCCSPPGALADRPARVGAGRRRARSTSATALAPARPPASGRPQAVAVEARAGRGRRRGCGSTSRSRGAAAGSRCRAFARAGRLAEHGRRAGGERQQAEQDAEKRRLPGSVRARARRRARPARSRGRRRSQIVRPPSLDRGAAQLDGRRHRLPSARLERRRPAASSWRDCHCSKVSLAGESVSVTVATGMSSARRERGELLDLRRDVLAVEDPHRDPAAGELALDRLPCRRR